MTDAGAQEQPPGGGWLRENKGDGSDSVSHVQANYCCCKVKL